jgi:hypothetical protein
MSLSLIVKWRFLMTLGNFLNGPRKRRGHNDALLVSKGQKAIFYVQLSIAITMRLPTGGKSVRRVIVLAIGQELYSMSLQHEGRARQVCIRVIRRL